MQYIRLLYHFIRDIIRNRYLIIDLSKRDFKHRYLGSYLGIIWAFVQPAMMIAIFWFVFEVGFRSTPVKNVPFVLWLMAGMIPWFFLSESISSATWSVTENTFLVKKVLFRVSLLPIIKITSALVIHLFFIGVLVSMFAAYGYPFTIYQLQIIYYLFAAIILVLGLTWLTSSLIVFLRDIGQLVAMLLQFGFWLTPIFWSIEVIPVQYRTILKLNPAYYIVEGYRNSFIYHHWFWEDPTLTIYYWVIAGTLFAGGAVVFHKLRPHFADVL